MSIEEYFNLWKDYGIEGISPPVVKFPKRKVERPVTVSTPLHTLEDVRSWLGDCRRCGLCAERKKIVFGAGSPKASLLFVGEGPGADEDEEGEPFVGKAGLLLNKIIEAMGYRREEVYIANAVKCRPPGNRVPAPEEIEQCLPFLKEQLRLINPRVVVALGLTAAKALTGADMTMGNLRGRYHACVFKPEVPVMPTYHPAYLLRNPDAKKTVWEDMKLVKKKLESL